MEVVDFGLFAGFGPAEMVILRRVGSTQDTFECFELMLVVGI